LPTGNMRFFKINSSYPLLHEVKNSIEKTCGAENLLRCLVLSFVPIKAAFIFCSYARNSMSTSSDIDLLIVANEPGFENDFIEKLSAIEKKFNGRLITLAALQGIQAPPTPDWQRNR
jgi:predicted nucleotidyltransferase